MWGTFLSPYNTLLLAVQMWCLRLLFRTHQTEQRGVQDVRFLELSRNWERQSNSPFSLGPGNCKAHFAFPSDHWVESDLPPPGGPISTHSVSTTHRSFVGNPLTLLDKEAQGPTTTFSATPALEMLGGTAVPLLQCMPERVMLLC